MGEYFVRVFCTAGDVPPPIDLVDWLEARELRVRLNNSEAQNAKWRSWSHLELVYQKDRSPIPATCTRGEEAQREAERFIEQIGPVGASKVKKRVVEMLKKTRFIVTFQHPVDMDDVGYDVSGQLLTYFDENNAALIEADREGFYERSKLVLKVPGVK